MKRKQNLGIAGLAAAAFVLTVSAAAGRTMAYFTTNVTAVGKGQIHLAPGTAEIREEEVVEWRKHITVTNTGERDCFVRLRVFAGEQERLTFLPGAKWKKGTSADEYGSAFYYYQEILPAGSTTEEFQVQISHEGLTDDLDVIVVQECTPADLYEPGMDPEQAEWTAKTETVRMISGNDGEADGA